MSDITMCRGIACPKKFQCYRFTALPNEYRQSYFVTPPWKEPEGCVHFSPNETPKENKNADHHTRRGLPSG